MTKRRRGRKPPKQIPDRYPSGRVKQADPGPNPWATMHRQALVGKSVREDGTEMPNDIAMTRSNFAVLVARTPWIEDHHFRAGEKFQALAWSAFGKPFEAARNYTAYLARDPGAMPEDLSDAEREERDIRARERYQDCLDALKAAGSQVCEEVRNVCQYDRYPGWAARDHVRPSDDRRAKNLLAGLDVLVDLFGVMREAA